MAGEILNISADMPVCVLFVPADSGLVNITKKRDVL